MEITDIKVVEPDLSSGIVIKVVGVGGAGGNAVQHMIERGVQGVEFICANTDAQALQRSGANKIIQLGKTGLGAGARPEVGRMAAEDCRDKIADAIRGANMVFITGGMGGGTGTGAAPVVAQIAKEMGILTVGVVSKPFQFEGKRRMDLAEVGANELSKNVDSLIVVLNQKLFDVMDDDAGLDEAFKKADDVLYNAVAGIAEVITSEGIVNVDFEDVRTVMAEQGKAMMGTATAKGPDRARIATEQAVQSPLLEGINLAGVRGVVLNITGSRSSLKLRETREAAEIVSQYTMGEATLIFGAVYDDSMGDEIRVTIIATGLGDAPKPIKGHEPQQFNQSSNDSLAAGHNPWGQAQGTSYPSGRPSSVNTAPSFGSSNPYSSVQRDVGATPHQTPAAAYSGMPNSPSSTPAHDSGKSPLPPGVWQTVHNKQAASSQVDAMKEKGYDTFDIPTFLRNQAD